MQIEEHSSVILTQNPGTDNEIRIIAKVLPEVVVRYTELMNQIMNPEDYDNQIELLKQATREMMENPIMSKEKKNPYYPYLNKFHKKSEERKMKELEEQKNLKLNSKEEVKKMFEMHERIAKKYPNDN